MSFKHTFPPLCYPLVQAGAARRLEQTNNMGNLGAGTPIWSPQGRHNSKHSVLYTGILSSSTTVLFAVGTLLSEVTDRLRLLSLLSVSPTHSL